VVLYSSDKCIHLIGYGLHASLIIIHNIQLFISNYLLVNTYSTLRKKVKNKMHVEILIYERNI